MATKKKGNYRNTYLAILVLFLLLIGLGYIKKNRSTDDYMGNYRTEKVAQLFSEGQEASYATATKDIASGGTVLNIAAYMKGGAQDSTFGAWLINGQDEPVYLGQLTLTTEIYTLNYESPKDYESYNEVIIAKIEKDNKMGEPLLKGSFGE